MRFFGPHLWGFAAEDPALRTTTPVGAACDWCGDLVVAGDYGVTMPRILSEDGGVTTAVFHRECHLRQIFGSVGHQQLQCRCYGGTTEDPPELTKRQAARAAVDYFERHPPAWCANGGDDAADKGSN
jgi:hypothetical protein